MHLSQATTPTAQERLQENNICSLASHHPQQAFLAGASEWCVFMSITYTSWSCGGCTVLDTCCIWYPKNPSTTTVTAHANRMPSEVCRLEEYCLPPSSFQACRHQVGDYHEVLFILEYIQLQLVPVLFHLLLKRVSSLHLTIFLLSAAFVPSKSSKFSIWRLLLYTLIWSHLAPAYSCTIL